ncbi:ABC transporter substrate-binding protein [Streptomyces sp. NPDC021212]|uniref:ABC transporter substrate-binding protein n=1 Tax=Streptomyces sp. NPDC021212 TaxID=3365118 RepID=UPI0037B4BDB4
MRRRTLMGRRTLLTGALATPAALLPGCAPGRRRACGGEVVLRFQSLAWQKESVQANRKLVAEWNAAHPGIRVEYIQGSWDGVHDQLLTSFEGGEAPDIIHDAADDLADFAYGGYLADLRGLLPDRLMADIPAHSWATTTFGDGVHGVPFLQEPRVIIANRTLLERARVRIPTVRHPWSWAEFEDVARALTRDGTHGVAWPLKDPVAATLGLALTTGGRVFHRGADGKVTVRFGAAEQRVPRAIARTAATSTLGMGGSDTLPGFFGGKYAMVPLGFSYRQQIVQQAPEGFAWTVLPAPAGPGGDQRQGVSPQTLSIAEDSPYQREAARFLDFFLRPRNMARLALGDWMLPTGTGALRDPALHTAEHGWATGTALADRLRPAPALSVRGYPEWKDKVATPALQEYYSGAIGGERLRKRLIKDGGLVLARYQR